MRSFQIKNFRNIDGEIKIPNDGGLVVLIGGNNDGKSNVLSAMSMVENFDLKESDIPNFYDHNGKPEINFFQKTFKIENLENKRHFEGKTFGIKFTKGSLEKGMELNGVQSQEEYYNIVLNEFENSEIYALHDYDEAKESDKKREEIRLILPSFNKVYLCSVTRGGIF